MHSNHAVLEELEFMEKMHILPNNELNRLNKRLARD